MLCGIWVAAAFVYRALALREAAAFQRRVDAFRPPRGVPGRHAAARAPRCFVLLRPLRGAADHLDACLASLFRAARRSGARVLLGVAEPDDPAAKEAQRHREHASEVPSSLRIGPGPPGWNRKIANLVQLSRPLVARSAGPAEREEIWVLSDADIRVPDDYVARLASGFDEPRVGLVTCPYRSVPGAGLASRIDALVSNTHFLPSTCAAVRFEGVRFALGSTIAVRRDALDEAGGLAALLDEPGDDWMLGHHVLLAGHELAWAPLVVEHVLEDGGLRPAWLRHVRWARVSRSVRPGGYLGFVLVSHGWLPSLGLAVLGTASGGPGWVWAAPALWWLAMAGLVAAAGRAVGARRRDLWLLPLVDAFACSAALVGLRGRATPPP